MRVQLQGLVDADIMRFPPSVQGPDIGAWLGWSPSQSSNFGWTPPRGLQPMDFVAPTSDPIFNSIINGGMGR